MGAGLIWRISLALVCLAVALVAAAELPSSLAAAALDRRNRLVVADLIQPPGAEAAAALDANRILADRCAMRGLRAIGALRFASLRQLAAGDNDAEVRGLAHVTRAGLVDHLRCAPTDGLAWIRLAFVDAYLDPGKPHVERAVGLSRRFAPFDAPVIALRLKLTADAAAEARWQTEAALFVRKAWDPYVADLMALLPDRTLAHLTPALEAIDPVRRARIERAAARRRIGPRSDN